MTHSKQDLNRVRDYYTSIRQVGSTSGSIYTIWEQGGAFNDSVTPSTYVPEYRSHMVLKLLSLTGRGATIFSLGCGNGFVEGDLVCRQRTVRAIDCIPEAVELTRKKGVDAFAADYFTLSPTDTAGVDVVYGDGILGHLFDPEEELRSVLEKLSSLDLKSGAYLVFSNDAPRDPQQDFAPHERVEDFWFLSRAYLQKILITFGFAPVEGYYFPYLRPISGMRNRTICVARVP
jgi:SAM-dependent methyltransferase